jgi:hypothetical protein
VLARKSRRLCVICIKASSMYRRSGVRAAPVSHAFNSPLISFRKRQSVPSAMILLGFYLIRPTSCKRRA